MGKFLGIFGDDDNNDKNESIYKEPIKYVNPTCIAPGCDREVVGEPNHPLNYTAWHGEPEEIQAYSASSKIRTAEFNSAHPNTAFIPNIIEPEEGEFEESLEDELDRRDREFERQDREFERQDRALERRLSI